MFKSPFSIYFLIFVSSYTVAQSIDKLKESYVEMIMECSEQYPLSANDMDFLKEKLMPDSESAKCLFACVYKKAGMMNDKGELWIDGVNEMSRKYFSDDPEKIKKSEEFTQACGAVNEIVVSDGERGCERAALIFKCTLEKAPDFDLL